MNGECGVWNVACGLWNVRFLHHAVLWGDGVRSVKREVRIMVALMCVLLGTTSAVAQDVKIIATVDSTHYQIGDWINVTVTAEVAGSEESIQPIIRDSLGQFEVLKMKQRNRHTWMVQLTTFDTGRVFVPPIEFSYTLSGDTTRRVALSNALFLTLSAPVANLQEDIRDIKPPFDAPWLFEDIRPYLIALALIALAIAGYYYWRKRSQKKEVASVSHKPAIPAHTLVLMQLRELEEKRLWQQGKVKEYYSEATEIVRRFFEGRYGIPALELTSDEVMQQLKPLPDAQVVWKQLQSFFTTADLVKFAKYDPTPAEHDNEMKLAYDIVRAMIPKPVVQQSSEMEESVDVR